MLALLTLLSGCRGESARVDPQEERLVALEAAFFSEELKPCTESSECSSGHCDLTPVYTISVSAGYCVSFPSAYERWQKVELAGHLADYVGELPQLAKRIEARLAKEYLNGDRPADLETAYIVLLALGTDEAIARLAAEYESRTGTVQEVAGLALAEAGDERGIDAVVGAAFSPVVRVRLHAARAAGHLCSAAALGVLAELLDDDNSLVLEAAATALGQCPGERSLALLKEHHGFAAQSARLEARQ
jgi:hypothetical protein